jgi:gamma-polyglutamate biosynthesis protein CapA
MKRKVKIKNKKVKFKRKKTCVVIFVLVILLIATIFYGGRETKILFVGDMMFDRYIRQVSYNKGGDYIFSCISDFLRDSDMVVGNLEGPITENSSVSMFTEPGGDRNFTFTFPTDTAKLLAKNNIKLVSLGNNHINNFGESGITSTKKFLSEAGVEYFGLPSNRESLVDEEEINGNKISFVNYNEFENIPADEVIEKIKEEKSKGQIVIVYAHWGDEYVAPPQRVKNIAKKFAESGANFIIGSHPHVVLENEMINNTKVYYSLGNFIFDQYFDKEVSTGLVLELNIKNGKINVVEHKVLLNEDGRTCLAD